MPRLSRLLAPVGLGALLLAVVPATGAAQYIFIGGGPTFPNGDYGDYANTSIVFSVDFDNLYRKFVSGNEPGEDGSGGLPLDPDDLLPGGGQLPKVPQLPQLGPRGTGPGGSAGGLDELLGGGGR